jgi:hypothetical protein
MAQPLAPDTHTNNGQVNHQPSKKLWTSCTRVGSDDTRMQADPQKLFFFFGGGGTRTQEEGGALCKQQRYGRRLISQPQR